MLYLDRLSFHADYNKAVVVEKTGKGKEENRNEKRGLKKARGGGRKTRTGGGKKIIRATRKKRPVREPSVRLK